MNNPVVISIIEQNGRITSIDQQGNAETGIENSIAYLAGRLKVIHIPESGKNYSITLKGTGEGTTDLTLIQPKEDEVEIITYTDIPTDVNSVASLDIGEVPDEIEVDLDNDGSVDRVISANVEPLSKYITT